MTKPDPITLKKGQLVVWDHSSYGSSPSRFKVLCYGWRPIRSDELAEWYKSDASKGMDDAGETKLPPREVRIEVRQDRVYEVIRARCTSSRDYDTIPKCAELLCFATGERFFIERRKLRHV
jgi:hypothetical protein